MIKTVRGYPLSKDELVELLSSTGKKERTLFNYSSKSKLQNVGNEVYLRGLIELTNVCEKDCFYCGIRKSNKSIRRYSLKHEEVIELVKFAYEKGYGSVAIQTGEIKSAAFTNRIDRIIKDSKKITNNQIGITLSCGEQCEETYRRWFESGADRYLLRIETSSEELYKKLHPTGESYSFSKRLKALELLRKTDYQVGTGVMIGLPFQTMEILADDLIFMKEFDIDMCGMGPYIEHAKTPLFEYRGILLSPSERFNLGLKMISLLRILMPDINIAATTAMQTLDKKGREKAIVVGANVIMPNITTYEYRKDYFLYESRPLSSLHDEDELSSLDKNLKSINHKIGYFKQGNSKRYLLKH